MSVAANIWHRGPPRLPESTLRRRWKEVGLGLLNLLAVILVIAAVQPPLRKYIPTAGAAVLGLICLVTYLAAVKWIERRNPTELAPRRALPEIAAGIALGFILFSAVMAILLAAGIYHPAG